MKKIQITQGHNNILIVECCHVGSLLVHRDEVAELTAALSEPRCAKLPIPPRKRHGQNSQKDSAENILPFIRP